MMYFFLNFRGCGEGWAIWDPLKKLQKIKFASKIQKFSWKSQTKFNVSKRNIVHIKDFFNKFSKKFSGIKKSIRRIIYSQSHLPSPHILKLNNSLSYTFYMFSSIHFMKKKLFITNNSLEYVQFIYQFKNSVLSSFNIRKLCFIKLNGKFFFRS